MASLCFTKPLTLDVPSPGAAEQVLNGVTPGHHGLIHYFNHSIHHFLKHVKRQALANRTYCG